jgi:hypothetical protein
MGAEDVVRYGWWESYGDSHDGAGDDGTGDTTNGPLFVVVKPGVGKPVILGSVIVGPVVRTCWL